MGKVVMLCGLLFGIVAMTIWYLLLRGFLKKNEGKNANEIKKKVKIYMRTSSAITVIALIIVVIGVFMSFKGI